MPEQMTPLDVLEYGRESPLAHWVRQAPRPSWCTVLLVLLAAVALASFWADHDPWVVQQFFGPSSSTLVGWTLTPDGHQILPPASPPTAAPRGHASGTYGSPDTTHIVVANPPNPIRTYDAGGRMIGEQPLDHVVYEGGDAVVAFSPDGVNCAVADNGCLNLIDLATGHRSAPQLDAHACCRHLLYMPDGKRLLWLDPLTVHFHSTAWPVMAIDARLNRVVATTRLTGWTDGNGGIIASPDGRHVAIFNGDATADVLDATTLASLSHLTGCSAGYSAAPFSPDGSRMVTVAQNVNAVELRETRGWVPSSTIRDPAGAFVRFSDAVFAGDADHVLTATTTGLIRLWHRRRPEAAWGVVALPGLWVAVIASAAALASTANDLRRWAKPALSR